MSYPLAFAEDSFVAAVFASAPVMAASPTVDAVVVVVAASVVSDSADACVDIWITADQ